jgi:hypothetical protein
MDVPKILGVPLCTQHFAYHVPDGTFPGRIFEKISLVVVSRANESKFFHDTHIKISHIFVFAALYIDCIPEGKK